MDTSLRYSQGKSIANFAELSIDAVQDSLQPYRVINSEKLLGELAARGISKADIARALKIDPAGVTRLFKGDRQLLLDEAVKLVEEFQLEQDRQPLPSPILRLVIRHVAATAGVQLSEELISDLTEDLREFAVFASEPRVRETLALAEGFFEGLRRRRPADTAAPPGTDHAHAN